jgi:hypothetical protein
MFSWRFRSLWSSGIDRYLREDLAQAELSAQAMWRAQHAAQGTHAAVTATSVTAPRLALTDSVGNPWSLYVTSAGTLYIVAGTTASGGTVVGTQT